MSETAYAADVSGSESGSAPASQTAQPVTGTEADALAHMLSTSEAHIMDLALRARLPFTVTGSDGLHVHNRDLPAWRHAALVYPATISGDR